MRRQRKCSCFRILFTIGDNVETGSDHWPKATGKMVFRVKIGAKDWDCGEKNVWFGMGGGVE